MIEGTPRFNALAIAAIKEIDLITPGQPVISAVAAYVNTADGKTYGSFTMSSWSAATQKALADLVACMERDAAERMFGSYSTGSETSEPTGIGEELEQV